MCHQIEQTYRYSKKSNRGVENRASARGADSGSNGIFLLYVVTSRVASVAIIPGSVASAPSV